MRLLTKVEGECDSWNNLKKSSVEHSNMDLPRNNNFDELNELVKDGKLNVKLILANTRTGSTLLETSFLQNPAIDTYVHEPFYISGDNGEIISGYETILKIVKPEIQTSSKPINVLVKEISKNLIIGNEYQRFLALAKNPPILLIRNPLLSTESKIRTVIKSLNRRISASLQDMLLNYYKQTNHYNMDLHYRENKTDKSTDQGTSRFGFQNRLLDYFAVSKGFVGWLSMIEETFATQSYKPFEDILKDRRIYKLEPSATLEQMHYLQSTGRDFVVVDSTDYRLGPYGIVKALCEKWKIPFSSKMVEWGPEGKKLITSQNNLDIWFERVKNSIRIEKPNEISPVLADFPDFIANHVIHSDIPAYYEMFNIPNRSKSSNDLFHKQIDVPIIKRVYQRLQEIGVLPMGIDLVGKKDYDDEIISILKKRGIPICFKSDTVSQSGIHLDNTPSIKLPIFYIDPIFSLISTPKLIRNSEFLTSNKRYLPTLEIITRLANRHSFNNDLVQPE